MLTSDKRASQTENVNTQNSGTTFTATRDTAMSYGPIIDTESILSDE